MTSPEDPRSLLAKLKERYGVEESCPPFGSAVTVPNSEYEPGWTRQLNQAGLKVFCGEKAGRVVWVIPLNARRSTEKSSPRHGCITGQPWTPSEDEQLIAVLDQDKSAAEIARELAPQLHRTERAVKDRALKLRRQQAAGSGPGLPGGPRLEATSTDKAPPKQPAETQQIRSLLESALTLANDSTHRPALRVILQTCLHLAKQNHPK